MRKSKLLAAIVVVVMLQFAMVGTTLAYWNVSSTAVNLVSTGKVDGKVVEQYDPSPIVYPGDVISKVVNVQNTGNLDMITRVKIEKFWEDSNGKPDNSLSPDNIIIEFKSALWLDGKDGYYYYKGILKPGEITKEPLFSSFTLAKETGNKFQGKKAQIIVNMECVQSTGNAISIWNKTYSNLGLTEPTFAEVSAAKVTFNGPDTKFSFDPTNTDLFGGFKSFAPGETRVQKIDLTNAYRQEVEIFLRAETVNTNLSADMKAKMDELLKKYATLEVATSSGKRLYYGPLIGTDNLATMKSNISLGVIASNAKESLTVKLSLSGNPGNEYQGLLGNVTWVFSASQVVADPTPTPTPKPTPIPEVITESPNPQADPPEVTPTPLPVVTSTPIPYVPIAETYVPQGNLPHTGDDGVMNWLVGGIVALTVVLAVLLIAYFRIKKPEDDVQ